jgi:hypothetical protein
MNSLRGGYEDRTAAPHATEEPVWLITVLTHELERVPVEDYRPFVAKANDVLERVGSPWRISAMGSAVRVTV